MAKRLVVMAGPNGSGKSTIISKVAENPNFPQIYLSPDEVVKDRDYADIEPLEAKYGAAMSFCEDVRNYALANELSVAFETVFSTPEKLEFLNRAKALGYKVEVVFVTTCDPRINIANVAQRVAAGGHDVPSDKVISRYERTMDMLPLIAKVANTLAVYDTSLGSPRAVYFHAGKFSYSLNVDICLRPWTSQAIIKPLKTATEDSHTHFSLGHQETKIFIGQNNNKDIGLVEFG